jgi:hypothetical protein
MLYGTWIVAITEVYEMLPLAGTTVAPGGIGVAWDRLAVARKANRPPAPSSLRMMKIPSQQ